MLEKIIAVGFAGMIGCGCSNYYNQPVPPMDYLNQHYLPQGNIKRINPDAPGEEEYKPKSEEEISDKQQTIGWCVATIVSAGLLVGGINNSKRNPEAEKPSLAVAGIGGLVMIPSVPLCIYGLAKPTK